VLDEPSAGVPASESQLILDRINGLSDTISVLMIEHDMDMVFRFAERITVLVDGGILVQGTPREIATDERVRAVYLGEAHD
jgi:branched-chain amino acid transport system ATP-binding protein